MKGDGSLGLGGKRGGVKVISRLLEPGLEDVEEKKDYLWLGVGVNAFNSSTEEAEILSLRSAWLLTASSRMVIS